MIRAKTRIIFLNIKFIRFRLIVFLINDNTDLFVEFSRIYTNQFFMNKLFPKSMIERGKIAKCIELVSAYYGYN
jgi:hypothetical protein